MSYNTPKIINVFYKEDRKPYDENGKAISYFGEDFIGANDATKIRFYFTPTITLEEFEGAVHAKRADGEVRYEILRKSSDELGSYLELSLNAWFTSKVGKVTLSVKIYSGDITYGYAIEGEPPTSIESLTNAVIVASDVFSFNVGYAPNATEVAPPFDDTDIDQFLTALSQKASLAQTIYVVPELPEDLSNFDNQWFLVKSPTGGNIGKLYHINLPDAEEVELGLETLKLTATGNGNVTTNTGKLAWDEAEGTATLGLYNDVNLQIGQEIHYYGKASGTIANGDIVQFAGIQGDHYLIKKAVQSEVNANPRLIMGMATQNMVNNAFGYVTAFGKVNVVDTKSQPVGSYVWFDASGSTAGNWTTTEPTAPNAKVLVGVIVKAESSAPANNGIILIRPTFEPRLRELQDVAILGVEDGDTLRYNSTLTRWENTNAFTTAQGEIDTLQSEMDAVEGRLDTAEDDIDQLETDVVDLDERLDFIEVNGGIDYVKVADFASLPSSGEARERRLFLTEDTQKLYNYSTLGGWEEVRQDKLTSVNGEENGYVTTDYGTRITYSGPTEATVLQVIQTSELGNGKILEAVNADGVQFAVNKDGSVNAYGDLTIAGNLTVSGTTTTVNTATLDIEDNIITINKNQTGTPETTLLSGIEVERGDQTNFQFVFQESSDLFKVGQVGDLQAVATREDSPTDKGVPFFNSSTNKFETDVNFQFDNSSKRLLAALLRTVEIRNSASVSNGQVLLPSTGVNIVRNIADANPSLIVNLANASSTGNIANFQFAGTNKLEVTKDGFLTQNGTRLFTQTGGNTNTFFGTSSGGASTSGDQNTAFGNQALLSLTSGTLNSGFGRNALVSLTTGIANTAFGRTSMVNLTTGSNNTALGVNAGNGITTGLSNTFLGVNAGVTGQLATAENSTAIGNASFTDKSNQMVFGNASVTEFKFDRNASAVALLPNASFSGNVGIGTTSPQAKLDVANPSGASFLRLSGNAGNVANVPYAGIEFFNYDNSGDGPNVASFIEARTINSFGLGADLVFGTIPSQTGTEGFRAVDRMVLTSDGKVGIGMTSPVTQLDITSGDISAFRATRTTTTTNDVKFLGTFRATTSANMVDGFGSRLSLAIQDSAGVENIIGAISSIRSGADNSGRFAIETNNAGTMSEKMTIMPNGNVGIGTSSPSGILTVVADTTQGNGSGFRIQSSSGATRNLLWFSTSSVEDLSSIQSYKDGTGVGVRNLLLNPNGGNIGIGTTSPAYKLDIGNGDIRVQNGGNVAGAGGSINFNANAFLPMAQIKGILGFAGSPSGVAQDQGDLGFFTRPSTGNNESLVERVRITHAGNVGIGISNPAERLSTLTSIGIFRSTSADPARLFYRTGGQIDFTVGLRGTQTNYTIQNETLGTTAFTLLSSNNNVGINETSPTAQLQVKSGATSRVPLIVDTLASQTANLQEWNVNGSTLTRIDNSGFVRTAGVLNRANGDRSRIFLSDTGTVIERNINSSNPVLIVNQVNASATGDITTFQKAGTTQSFVDNRGVFYKNETKLTLTEPTFTEVSTDVFEYTITETQINNNDVIEITKTATASGQIYRLIVPNNSKQVRIWYTIIGFGASTIAEVSLLKTLGERVEYIFDRQEANGASLIQADTSNYLNYNVSTNPISFLYKNVNGTQKTLSVTFDNEI